MNPTLKYGLLGLLLIGIITFAFADKKKSNENGIKWVTVEQAEALMKKTPKKIYVDVFTSWCGWCKVMDKKTFSNPDVIAYMNENFYCIHMDAENTSKIMLKGKEYGAYEGSKNNALAVEWLGGRMSYPTSVFLDEDFVNPQPVPGYLEVPQIEMIAKYFVENKHKTTPFETYQKEFKSTWKFEKEK